MLLHFASSKYCLNMNMEILMDLNSFGNFCVRTPHRRTDERSKKTCCLSICWSFRQFLFTYTHCVSVMHPSILSGTVWFNKWNRLSSKTIARSFAEAEKGGKRSRKWWMMLFHVSKTRTTAMYTHNMPFVPTCRSSQLAVRHSVRCMCMHVLVIARHEKNTFDARGLWCSYPMNGDTSHSCKHIRIIYANQRIHFTHTIELNRMMIFFASLLIYPFQIACIQMQCNWQYGILWIFRLFGLGWCSYTNGVYPRVSDFHFLGSIYCCFFSHDEYMLVGFN